MSRAAEGYSPTWYPHIYRLKLKQIVDSQEFKDILNIKMDEENPGQGSLRDLLSTYEKEMQSNTAVIQQAEADAKKSGYETSHFFSLQVGEDGKVELVTTDTTQLDASTANELADRVMQTPERIGYSGYILGDGIAPNGEVFGHGITFPAKNVTGDYFLRTDIIPNRLFRYSGSRWIKVEDNVRMTMTQTDTRNTQKAGFVNNTATAQIGGETVQERQSLSKALRAKTDSV